MQSPVEIAFHNTAPSEALEDLIRDRAEKMERYFNRITSCHVVVEVPHRSQGGAKAFHVRIEARVPGTEIVVSRDPGKSDKHDPYQAVSDAFDAMDRRLEHFSQRVRGDIKQHDGPPTGRVRQLFTDYGFIATSDGRDIWFHRASVAEDGFDGLAEGQAVELSVVEEGENGMGPQASFVRPVGPMKLDGDPAA